jgi:surface carbohydrate biosynthesis protein (TIGR04326 family)
MPAAPSARVWPQTDAQAGAELLLWTGAEQAAPPHANLLLWQGSARRSGARSLVEYTETHAVEVRRRYLAWAHELGEREVAGRKLREHFRLKQGDSFWWYSLFVEQSAWKQHSLEALIKLMALELLLQREAPAQLIFAGAPGDYDLVLRTLCARAGVSYRSSPQAQPATTMPRSLRRSVPRMLKGVAGLMHFARIWLALRGGARLPAPGSRGALLCGQFANHDGARGGRGFVSRFWGDLPQVLRKEGYDVQWLHVFYATEQTPTARAARRLLGSLNAHSPRSGAHMFVESRVAVGGLVRVAWQWLQIALESQRIGRSLRAQFAAGDGTLYWPLIRDDWANAFRGFDCVQNLFYMECFAAAFARLPHYEEGLYLMENHAWERTLARAWRQSGQGRLTGVAHSTVRFWDLRYQSDPRRYEAAYRQLLPGPDCVAVNSRSAREAYLASCAERESIVESEALRYLHLVAGRPRDFADLKRGEPLRMLVLGDYTRERTEALLGVAQRLTESVTTPLEIAVKPHPGCPLDRERSTGTLHITQIPVAELVAAAHFVLASNTTSAALEAYVSGARLLVLDDCSGVNYSPLRGVADVAFVRDAQDVERVISAREADGRGRQADAFFNIDPQLPRWRRYFEARREAAHSRNSA